MEIKKRGSKLIKYLELTKWFIFNNLHNRYTAPTGKKKTDNRTMAFLRSFEKMGKRIKAINDAIMKGPKGIQS
jgi:hypothetical protein